MKTFVLTVSRVFPTTHKMKGKETYFKDKIELALGKFERGCVIEHDTKTLIEFWPKLHTIRSSYELWAKRIKQVQDGKAILSIRYWSGKPYDSKQVEICQLDKSSGCGVQKLGFGYGTEGSFYSQPLIIDDPYLYEKNGKKIYVDSLAKNDGLSLEDFKEWFKGYDLSKPMAIIHFTKFRY